MTNKYRIELTENEITRPHSDPLIDNYNIECGVSAIEVMDGGLGGHKHYLCQISDVISPGMVKSGVVTLDASKRVEIPCNCLDTPNNFKRRTNLDFNALFIEQILTNSQ